MDVHSVSAAMPEMPAMVDGVKLAAVAAVLYVMVRCLNLKSPTASPDLFFQDSPLARHLLKSCPLLTKEYVPPLLWGKSGHVQTVLYGKMGRVSCPQPHGLRKTVLMPDGSSSTFDLFEALAPHSTGEDFTMVICPGIANHSEKTYIRTFVDHAQRSGYRCAVLNHLGALASIKLTAPRMFTYGCTWEYGAMVRRVRKLYPNTKLVVVGFSMGGNIVCKFLGEDRENQEGVACCISVGQGYSALIASPTFLQWDNFRRFYNFMMADNMKRIILSHKELLLGDGNGKRPSCLQEMDFNRLYTATSLMQIDDVIMRKFHGYSTLQDYYEKESCAPFLQNIKVPMLLVNALDDPIVHSSLLVIPRTLAEKKENVMFALTLHGGHLGYFEGAVLLPEPLTWMDKLIVEYANAVAQWSKAPCAASDK
ncbi:monoacylglycerol lipase ABHD2 [Petromyzon marinus]|uniref:Monoacylglycerol lipase ABHD2 n=1 Tax=Petromyzon marinus TaxID=7757 RepID=A0AAJ7U4T7_PETMA|nr:monoacylglycerol lipase ABHD2 [Petromyzon marinus]XP_061428447.1 monoacylglycerol lipase ABHD2 [Lethenteron reissneri]